MPVDAAHARKEKRSCIHSLNAISKTISLAFLILLVMSGRGGGSDVFWT